MSDSRAMKLLEAFSGVDEELLVRSENATIGERVSSEVGLTEEKCLAEEKGLAEEGGLTEEKCLAEEKVLAQNRRIKKKISMKKSLWQSGRAWAAVMCLAVVGVVSWNAMRIGVNDASNEMVTEAIVNEKEAVTMETATGSAVYYPTADRAEDGGNSVSEDGKTGSFGVADGSGAEDAGTKSPAIESADAQETDAKGIAIGNADVKDANAEKSDIESAASENAGTEGINQEEAVIGNSGNALPGETESLREEIVIDIQKEEGCKEYTYVEITEAEALAHEIFGGYIPRKIPAGYVFEGAYVNGEEEAQTLMISWTRGMDSILLNFSMPENVPATVDVSRTEYYDEHLYEIPLAETVPEEYRAVFDNPVCAWEDFCIEFVEKRMIYRGTDKGDTNTPRGNFSVLYPDGVLMYFNGRGSAEEIWQLFSHIQETKTEY